MIDQNLQLQIMVFIILYILTFSLTALLLSVMGIDLLTAFSASIATIGNVGPGFGGVSSMANYGHLPDAAKYVLSFNMLLGRLEIMNVFALFMMLSLKRKVEAGSLMILATCPERNAVYFSYLCDTFLNN